MWARTVTPRGLLLMWAACFAQPVDLAGQDAPPVMPGQRIRVTTAHPPPLIGTLVLFAADSIVVNADSLGSRVTVPTGLVQRLEISRGIRSNAGRGAVFGFLAGGAVGGLVSYLACTGAADCPRTVAIAGAAVTGLLGAGIGALMGAPKRERWAVVILRPAEH